MWVCVSDPFDEFRVARAIIEALEGSASNLGELQSLLQRIQTSIAGKKFLLVLDDMWTDDYSKWEPFNNCLMNGLRGNYNIEKDELIKVWMAQGYIGPKENEEMEIIDLEELPETCCELVNLQTLDIEACGSLKRLPQGIGKLVNLRHLMISHNVYLDYMPKGIESCEKWRAICSLQASAGRDHHHHWANSTLSTAATILSYLTKVPLNTSSSRSEIEDLLILSLQNFCRSSNDDSLAIKYIVLIFQKSKASRRAHGRGFKWCISYTKYLVETGYAENSKSCYQRNDYS
ncbi:hypothetical protein WN943_023850 [Citrus x changshan-huyou]